VFQKSATCGLFDWCFEMSTQKSPQFLGRKAGVFQVDKNPKNLTGRKPQFLSDTSTQVMLQWMAPA